VAVLALAQPARAIEADGIVSIGYDAGGDELIKLNFTDGTTKTISANEGVALAVGAVFYHDRDLTWQTQATVGAKYRPVDATNGDAEWWSFPIEVIGFFNTNLIRFGAGATYQIAPQLKTTGVISGYSVELDNTFGLIAQVGFRPKKRGGISVDVRYTKIEYSGDAVVGGERQPISNVDGSSAGVYVSFLF
jgi:hypothetical protein